ncbi:MAG TPA: ROK family protein, partial [Gemmataceae bacterium]
MFLGIEIGGTKLQLGVGPGDGTLAGLWRGAVDVAAGAEGIRRQIRAAVPELLAQAGVGRARLRGAGVGFGGPVDDTARRVVTSHQVAGWDDFPLEEWLARELDLPVAVGNDADVAGLAEALLGASRGLSPVFYVTVGSGIGGGLIIDGKIYRGVGRGAAEIGHLRLPDPLSGFAPAPLEQLASGWAIERRARRRFRELAGENSPLWRLVNGEPERLTVRHLGEACALGDAAARALIREACEHLAAALCHVIALLCPRRVVIGGGVSLLG